LQRLPTKSVGGRTEAQRFPHDVFRIGLLGEIRHAGRVSAEDRLELGPELAFDVWMLRQQVRRPRQGQRRGLVTRDEQGLVFVTQLSIGHPGAIDVLRVQQQRQQVIAPRRMGNGRRNRTVISLIMTSSAGSISSTSAPTSMPKRVRDAMRDVRRIMSKGTAGG